MVSNVVVLRHSELFKGDRHSNETYQHGNCGGQEHGATLESCHHESERGGSQQTPALICKVDSRLGVRCRVAHHNEEQVLVVGEECVAGHLGEQTKEAGDKCAAAHAGGIDHIHP